MTVLKKSLLKATIEQWSKVTLSNSFMFRLVMEDKDICKETLELLLDMKIAEIGYLEPEKSLEASLGSKGVRLDIYIKDEAGVVYDLEMQATDKDKDALGKRTRYYQSIIDSSEIKKGARIRYLPRSIVLFICKYDPFKLDLLKYSFRNTCIENKNAELNDESLKVIINTKGKTEGFSQNIINFINYINNETVTDDFTQRLNDRVERWRLDDEKARAYMTYEQEMREAEARAKDEGIAIGKAEGKAEGIAIGKAEGKAEGRAEGKMEEKINIAENLIRRSVPAEVIAQSTKLSLEQIQEIATKIGVELA